MFDYNAIQDKNVKNKKQYVEELASYIANERIGVEICITSNLQTLPFIKKVSDHPVKQMIKSGLSVSICTDNRLVSNTSVTKELELLCDNINITKRELRNIVIAGFKGSFFHGPFNDKRIFVRAGIEKYNRFEQVYFK